MIPCQSSCDHYCEGCHKTCAKWRLLQARNRMERQKKKDYLQYYGSVGPTITFQSVLHRIGFTWQRSLLRSGELLPRLSILTGKSRRYLSVALSLKSPSAAVSSYPAL